LEKEGATATWKRTFGFHPLLAFLDHGPGGTGEQLAGLLRIGKATSNDAADHIAVLTDALGQLPAEQRSRVLIRGDSGAGVHAFLHHLHALGLHYSVGLYAHQPIIDALNVLPKQAWRAALDGDGQPRAGAQVAELTRWLRPSRNPWPPGMRVIARRERPHPGAQLPLTDADGWCITLFATNLAGGQIPEHELLHRQRARCKDRIRCAKDTGLRNLPLHGFAANQLWLEIVALAGDLLTWTQHLALTGTPARTWEPKRLRLRLLNIAGRVATSGRQRSLRLPRGWPGTTHSSRATPGSTPSPPEPAPPTLRTRTRRPRQTRNSTLPRHRTSDPPTKTRRDQDHERSRLVVLPRGVGRANERQVQFTRSQGHHVVETFRRVRRLLSWGRSGWDVLASTAGVAGASSADGRGGQAGLWLAWSAICAVSGKLGMRSAENLRTWVRRAEVDAGCWPKLTSARLLKSRS